MLKLLIPISALALTACAGSGGGNTTTEVTAPLDPFTINVLDSTWQRESETSHELRCETYTADPQATFERMVAGVPGLDESTVARWMERTCGD
jgi:hypothetical protein